MADRPLNPGTLDKGTPLGRARGLGSAHEGTADWTIQRVTACGNLLLMAWFVASLIQIHQLDYQNLHDWLGHVSAASAMILLIVSVFLHARNGLQIMFDDYVHEKGNWFAVSTAFNLLAVGGVVFGIVCVLKFALGVPG